MFRSNVGVKLRMLSRRKISILIVVSIFAVLQNILLVHTKQHKEISTAGNPFLLNVKPDSSIIIVSSLIPTHPSIKMIHETIDSIHKMIDGLHPDTPIFISIDMIKSEKFDAVKLSTLQLYLENLRNQFFDNPNIFIINNFSHGHINHSIRRVLKMVKTEFVYVFQHDLKFVKNVNHAALVKSMREHLGELVIVRFAKDRIGSIKKTRGDCKKSVEYNGISFTLGQWSDNNNFSTKRYFEEVIENLGPSPRPIEAPMMYKGHMAGTNCSFFHQYVYNLQDAPHIYHLDGRLTLTFSANQTS